MPDVIFDTEFKQDLMNGLGPGGPTDTEIWSRTTGIAIYTSGNLPNLSTITLYSDISSTGRLIFWESHPSLGNLATTEVDFNNDPGLLLYSSGFKNADLTGVASDFILYTIPTLSAGNIPSAGDPLGWCMTGTVTASGGGGDMVIGNTSIVSGTPYNIGSWQFRVLGDFTY